MKADPSQDKIGVNGIVSLQLGYLKPKQWRYLIPEEIAELNGETPNPSQPKKGNCRRPTRWPPKWQK
jgi:hypothetical protein